MRRETGDHQRGGFPALHPARFGFGLRQTAKSEIGNGLEPPYVSCHGFTHEPEFRLGNGKSRPGCPKRLWYYSRQFVLLHHGAENRVNTKDRPEWRLLKAAEVKKSSSDCR
jgi:hypothetical protein